MIDSQGKIISKEVRIETTNYCNSKCTICPREQMTREKTVMPLDHFFSLVDQVKILGAETITLFGYGEPLLDACMSHRITYCKAQGLDTFITTNGSLLDLLTTKLILDAGLSHIRFSVHGLFKADYENVHRGLDYLQVIRNIFNFLVVNKKKFDNQCTTSVSIIPMNHERIEDLVKFWEPNVDYVEIWRPHNWATGRKYRKVDRRKKTCGRPFSGPLQINADGKMMVCCFDTNAEMTIGDTYKELIREILIGEELSRIKNKHEAGDLSGLPCNDCDQLNEYDEDNNPLLYSNRDPSKQVGVTSTLKEKLQ